MSWFALATTEFVPSPEELEQNVMSDSEVPGRLLTVEECDWLNARGFEYGYDVDTCEPQLNHIVAVLDPHREKVEPLCGTPNLWGATLGWNLPRADGVLYEKDRRLKCVGCLSKFDLLFQQSETRTKRGLAWTLLHRKHDDVMGDIVESMREMGRHDLAMLLESVRVAYLTDTEMSEKTLRHVMTSVLALKSERIRRAMNLLSESDGE